jgi:hypothetical protein
MGKLAALRKQPCLSLFPEEYMKDAYAGHHITANNSMGVTPDDSKIRGSSDHWLTSQENMSAPNSSFIEPQSENHSFRFWPMRWFLLIIVVIWLLAAMTTTVVVIYLTKNVLSLSLFSTLAPPAYILYRITKFLFPKSEGDYQLKAYPNNPAARKAINPQAKWRNAR